MEFAVNLTEKFERYPLTFGPTPIEYLPRLTAACGGSVEIYAKREDCNSGLAMGGNKLRKLEFIVPDAIKSGADTLVSIGGVQSNHTRMVAATAAKIGMKCRLVQESWAPHDDAPPYNRIESILMKSFKSMPHFAIPDLDSKPSERVYEFRSYEGATEQLYERKVEMFNDAGEVELFKKLEFNPVFFAEVISSAHMPHLIYMTTFSDMDSQEKHWDAFREHPDWEKMKVMDRYQNTVSSITKYLMYPTDYSDI